MENKSIERLADNYKKELEVPEFNQEEIRLNNLNNLRREKTYKQKYTELKWERRTTFLNIVLFLLGIFIAGTLLGLGVAIVMVGEK